MQPTNFNDGEVIVRWPKIGAPEWRETRTTGADVRPNCVKRLAVLPDGTLIGEFGEERRAFIAIDKVPDYMKQAIIAAEDERF